MYKNFQEALTKTMEINGENRHQLASALGTDESVVRRWMSGKYCPSPKSMRMLIHHYSLDFEKYLDPKARSKAVKRGKILRDAKRNRGEIWSELKIYQIENNLNDAEMGELLGYRHKTSYQYLIKSRSNEVEHDERAEKIHDLIGIRPASRTNRRTFSRHLSDLPLWSDCHNGQRIVWLRSFVLISAERLAAISGYDRKTLAKYEKRKAMPASMASTLCMAMGFHPHSFAAETYEEAIRSHYRFRDSRLRHDSPFR